MLWRLIPRVRRARGKLRPRALERMGLSWEALQAANPRLNPRLGEGLRPGRYEDCKVYENVRPMRRRLASTTGWRGDKPMVTGAQIAIQARDSISRWASSPLSITGCRAGAATGRLRHAGQRPQPLPGEAARPAAARARTADGIQPFARASRSAKAVPRAGNDSGGGQPGRILKCRGWEQDPDAYLYFIAQAAVWEPICDIIGEPEWKTDRTTARPRRACRISTRSSRASKRGR